MDGEAKEFEKDSRRYDSNDSRDKACCGGVDEIEELVEKWNKECSKHNNNNRYEQASAK